LIPKIHLADTAKLVKVFGGIVKDETELPKPIEADKDGDGTPDSRDKCPSFKGAPEDGGCPRGLYDDSDGDGIADDMDKCPNKKGSFFNFGCPQREEVTFTENGIQFLPGQKEIEPASLPILDKMVMLLKDNPAHKIYIVGHTDNIGEAVTNLELSKQRAVACAEYFKRKGIEEERMSTDGFGEAKPIETNTTEAGRTRNRRVEFTFYTGNKKQK
jgi:outer membrane protein OmpA-like peptidoglycan-associated protein